MRLPDGKIEAEWYLLSNVSAQTGAEQLAEWYYWRWRIESYFKLLKSHGFRVDQWQQETAEAIAKRLLVAAMACVVVWQLQRATEPETIALRDLLVRLVDGRFAADRPLHQPYWLVCGFFCRRLNCLSIMISTT
ncbi:MAG: transposase [Blastocatellales bacterium]|nr:transposase [Blastocatellales bacterium]